MFVDYLSSGSSGKPFSDQSSLTSIKYSSSHASASWRFSLFWGGGIGYIRGGEHSVQDTEYKDTDYLHINGIILGGGSQFFLGGETPSKKQACRKPCM